MRKSFRAKDRNRRSSCPLSCALEILGDKWTLLIVRDLIFKGKTRFGDFLSSPERISTNILADRLRHLTEAGVARKAESPSDARGGIYVLTSKGQALLPALVELYKWSAENVPGTVVDKNLVALARKKLWIRNSGRSSGS